MPESLSTIEEEKRLTPLEQKKVDLNMIESTFKSGKIKIKEGEDEKAYRGLSIVSINYSEYPTEFYIKDFTKNADGTYAITLHFSPLAYSTKDMKRIEFSEIESGSGELTYTIDPKNTNDSDKFNELLGLSILLNKEYLKQDIMNNIKSFK